MVQRDPETHPSGALPGVMRRRADFLAANRGLRIARKPFVLLVRPNPGEGKRYGITVTKRQGNAVVRNRLKRRFRALLRELLPQTGLDHHDHVVIARSAAIERDFAKLRGELSDALAEAQRRSNKARRTENEGRTSARPARP